MAANDGGSLLPTPPVPVPIIAMHGGSTDLLPEPAVMTRIEPMIGGAKTWFLQSAIFSPKKLEAHLDLSLNEYKPISNEVIDGYIQFREKIWPGIVGKIYKEGNVIDIEPVREMGKTAKNLILDRNTDIYIFFVKDYPQLKKMLHTIRGVNETYPNLIYILINAIPVKNISLFSKIFKTILNFIQAMRIENLYFLYNKASTAVALEKDDKDVIKPSWVQALKNDTLLNFEPSYITFRLNENNLVFTSKTEFPADLDRTKTTVVTTTVTDGTTEFPPIEKKKMIELNLKPDTLYFLNSQTAVTPYTYLYLSTNEATTPLIVPPPAAAVPPPEIPPPPKTPPVSVTMTPFKQPRTTQVEIGGELFTIRLDAKAEWKKGVYSEEENRLWERLGLGESFLKENRVLPSLFERKKVLFASRPAFLENLVFSKCFRDTQYLLKAECETSRTFLQELYEIRTLERVRTMLSLLYSDTDVQYDVHVNETSTKDLLNITKLLDRIAVKTRPHLATGFSLPFLAGSSRIVLDGLESRVHPSLRSRINNLFTQVRQFMRVA